MQGKATVAELIPFDPVLSHCSRWAFRHIFWDRSGGQAKLGAFFFLLFLIFFFLCRSLFASRKVRLYILPFTTIARVVAIFVHSRSTSLRSYLPLVGIHSFSRSHYRIYSIPLNTVHFVHYILQSVDTLYSFTSFSRCSVISLRS